MNWEGLVCTFVLPFLILCQSALSWNEYDTVCNLHIFLKCAGCLDLKFSQFYIFSRCLLPSYFWNSCFVLRLKSSINVMRRKAMKRYFNAFFKRIGECWNNERAYVRRLVWVVYSSGLWTVLIIWAFGGRNERDEFKGTSCVWIVEYDQ